MCLIQTSLGMLRKEIVAWAGFLWLEATPNKERKATLLYTKKGLGLWHAQNRAHPPLRWLIMCAVVVHEEYLGCYNLTYGSRARSLCAQMYIHIYILLSPIDLKLVLALAAPGLICWNFLEDQDMGVF